jgi:hypothetical protein
MAGSHSPVSSVILRPFQTALRDSLSYVRGSPGRTSAPGIHLRPWLTKPTSLRSSRPAKPRPFGDALYTCTMAGLADFGTLGLALIIQPASGLTIRATNTGVVARTLVVARVIAFHD